MAFVAYSHFFLLIYVSKFVKFFKNLGSWNWINLWFKLMAMVTRTSLLWLFQISYLDWHVKWKHQLGWNSRLCNNNRAIGLKENIWNLKCKPHLLHWAIKEVLKIPWFVKSQEVMVANMSKFWIYHWCNPK